MITEYLITLATSFVGWVAGLFPAFENPTVLDQFAGFVTTAMGWFVGLGVWVDWGVLSACVAAQMLVTLAVFSAKGLRAALAHIPLFGGAGD